MRQFIQTAAALLLSLPALAAQPAPQAPMPFSDARTRLHQSADILRADDAEIARADYEASAAESLSGPRVTVSAQQVWGRKSIEIDLPIPLPMIGKSIGLDYELDGPRASVNAVMPIYTGGMISAQQKALKHKATETRADRDVRENQLDADLAAKYWGVQLARSVEGLRRNVLADQEAEVKRALRFEKKGLISKIERMSVEVARDTARRELIAAQTNTRVAETQLMKALRTDKLPELSSPLFVISGDLGTLPGWQDQARSASPVLRKMSALRAQAGEGISAAEGSFKPKVFAYGTRNLIKHYLTPVEPDWIAGIGVTFTLWDNRDRFDKLHAAQSVKTKAEAATNEAENEIATAVEVAYLRVTQAREEFDLTGSTVELARENLRLRESSFAEGLSTATDVDTARTQLTGAEIARRSAAYKFVVSWAMLHAAAGNMTAFIDSLNRNDLSAVR